MKQYFHYLDKAGIILTFEKTGGNLAALKKPEKVYLNNTNYIYALEGITSKDIGNIRETFSANILSNCISPFSYVISIIAQNAHNIIINA